MQHFVGDTILELSQRWLSCTLYSSYFIIILCYCKVIQEIYLSVICRIIEFVIKIQFSIDLFESMHVHSLYSTFHTTVVYSYACCIVQQIAVNCSCGSSLLNYLQCIYVHYDTLKLVVKTARCELYQILVWKPFYVDERSYL